MKRYFKTPNYEAYVIEFYHFIIILYQKDILKKKKKSINKYKKVFSNAYIIIFDLDQSL